MARNSAVAATIIGCLLLSGVALRAHHSVVGNFDQSKSMDVTGKVKEFAIRNPHSLITLEVSKADGGSELFFIEWSDKNALVRRNVPFDRIKIGDVLTVNVSPSRRLPNLGYFRTATLPDKSVIRDCGFAAFREGVAQGKSSC